MKTFLYIIGIGLFCVVAASIDCIGHDDMLVNYFIYVSGDSGKTVQISHPAQKNRGSNENVVITEQVQLPFFKEVNFLSGGGRDEDMFLEITSENDSTTKAAIFGYETSFSDGCPVIKVFENEDAAYWHECFYCEDLPRDSVLNYFKAVLYPCYLEFAKGETVKKVWLRDTFRWQPYE